MEKNLTEILDNAYNLHISGKLDEAKLLYEKLLKVDSENTETLNLYAQLLVSIKDYDTALSIFKKIYDKTHLDDVKINIAKIFYYKSEFNEVINILKSLNNNSFQVLNLLSSSYVKLNDYENAYKAFKALNDINKSFDNIYNIAFCLGNLHRYEEAYNYAHEAYLLKNSDYSVIMQCAKFSEELGNYEKAIEYLTEAQKISQTPGLLNKLGSLYSQTDKKAEALECYKQAISIDPKNKQAMLNIAFLYKTIDKNISISLFNELLCDYPDDKLIITSLYYMFFNMLDYENAVQVGLYYISKHPDDYFAYVTAGEAYSELYDYENASNMYKKALELNNDDECCASYGNCLYNAGHVEEGKKVLENLPDCENARYNLTTIYLREKEFKKCEELFFLWHTDIIPEKAAEDKARRFFYKLNLNNIYNVNEDMFVKNLKKSNEVYSAEKFNNLLKRAWRRENIKDKTLLLFSHNGAGDLIMFSRFIPKLKELCKKLIVYVPNSFLSIMKYNFPDIEIHSKKDDISENLFDYSATFFTILYSIDIDLKNIPYSEGYLNVDNKLVEEKSKLDILKTDKKKVGIYWQGNPTILRNRSIQLKYFEPLFNLKNIQLYSFQMSDIDKESDLLKKEKPIIDLAPLIGSYEDTAAFLKNMDVLVTIDTSIANLAGALGVKTILLLPKTTEWRWFFDKDKTPWYDSVKIFKAEKDLVWDDVIKRLEEELSK